MPAKKKVAKQKVAPKKAAPAKAAPKKAAPKRAAPKKAAPKRAAPKKTSPKKVASSRRTPFTRARAYALSFPGATEDFPWGETVMKVAKKVFVFLGRGNSSELGLSVKLPVSGAAALSLPFVTPTGYGLGKSGWVSASFTKADSIPLDLIEEWIEESYRTVAPKKLVAQLDRDREATASASTK
jgi:predicted DNA-binding protein (MmcQ/YjbR family)